MHCLYFHCSSQVHQKYKISRGQLQRVTSIYIHRDILLAESNTPVALKNCEPCILFFVDIIAAAYLFYSYKEDVNIQVGLFKLYQIIFKIYLH